MRFRGVGEDTCPVGRWGGAGVLSGGPHPDHLSPLLPAGYSTSSFLQMLHPECKELPEPNLLPGQLSHGAVGVKEGRVQWISMAFESVSSPWPAGHSAECSPHICHLIPHPWPECQHQVSNQSHLTTGHCPFSDVGCLPVPTNPKSVLFCGLWAGEQMRPGGLVRAQDTPLCRSGGARLGATHPGAGPPPEELGSQGTSCLHASLLPLSSQHSLDSHVHHKYM